MDIQFSNLLTKGLGILILLVIAGGFVFGIISLVRLFFKLKKLDRPEIIKYYFLMIICIFIMVISWVLNMGWYRIILTWLAFPVIHSALFAIVNGKAMYRLFLSPKLKFYTLLSCVTYIISYLSFPDGGDYGSMYVFFGLLHNNTVSLVAGVMCLIGFVLHIIVSILQLIEINRLKQKNEVN